MERGERLRGEGGAVTVVASELARSPMSSPAAGVGESVSIVRRKAARREWWKWPRSKVSLASVRSTRTRRLGAGGGEVASAAIWCTGVVGAVAAKLEELGCSELLVGVVGAIIEN